ncbi:MAG: SdiA-regulated domain-containing protein [Luteolibacter sp.]|uniref:SdiA-regulated domain-containing protein n=1 Tax=Luteolibacter sp. TaxID=1962973 RepID=UPI0032635653
MFTALNADEDGWAMVALVPIPANSTVYFTDNEWDGLAFNTGESYTQWVSGASTIPAGTVIRFLSVDVATLSASVGTLSRASVSGSSNWGISTGEDSVYAYQANTASSTPTAFLSAICNTSFGTAGAGFLSNTGLSVGNGALQTAFSGGSDFAEYNGTRTGQTTFAAYLPIISNVANWTVDTANGVYGTTIPNTTAFTVAASIPAVNLSVSANAGTEAGATVITVTATASAAATGDQTLSLAVTGTGITAGDYILSTTTITIPNGSTTGSVTFTIVDDLILEGDETALLTISSPSAGIVLGETTTRDVAITDNETTVDLSEYVRVGRYDLPEPTRTTPPANSLLAQEASGVAYNWDTGTLFIVGDGGTSVTEVTKTGQLVSSMTLPPGDSSQGTEFFDTEGITYIGGGEFVFTEERDRQAVRFTYVPGGTLTRSAAKTVKLGTTIDNIGLEGLSYDPQSSGFIFVKEAGPIGIFQTTIDFVTGTASNGSSSTVNSTNLFDPSLASLEDMSDVFALSNLPGLTGHDQAGNLLVLSQESGMVRNVDRSGNILSTLKLVADAGNPLSIQNQTHEGITVDREGNLYIVSENGGGDADHPQLWVYSPSNVANLPPTALALSSASSSLPGDTSTSVPVKMANIVVTDGDGVGANTLTLSGPDAADFQIIGSGLYLKAGVFLNFATKTSYSVSVNVDDTSVGGTPDASTAFTLNVTEVVDRSGFIRVTEVAPWSSGNSAVAADWFELTNTGSTAVDITGWKMTDSAATFGSAGPISGITSIAAGESVIFVDGSAKVSGFITNWFGANPPPGLQVGYYGGPGLSTGGDAVTIYDAEGTLKASAVFGTSTTTPGPFRTFDNTDGFNNVTIMELSVVGHNGAIAANATSNEIGSPGTSTPSATPLVSIAATDASAAEEGANPGTFRVSRTGLTVSPLDVNYTIATGAGQATAADYTPALTYLVTIPAGQSFVDITIAPVDDSEVEGTETVTLALFDTGSYDVGLSETATVSIADNDFNLVPTAVVLNNKVGSLNETTSTASAIKLADIAVTDDGQGTNDLSLDGPDAASFEIVGTQLFLKAGASLSSTTKPTYSIAIRADDITVGTTPDVSLNFTLAVTPNLVISEVAPWSSSNSPVAADWFEVTNKGLTTVDLTGLKVDDDSNAFASAGPVGGVTSIAPGESIILIDTTDLAVKAATFLNNWFGANSPAGLQIGSYTGAGGLGTGGDAVNLFDSNGNRVAGIAFGASTTGSFKTFENPAAIGSTALPLPIVATLSAAGSNGAFVAVNSASETGSPGSIANNKKSFAAWLAANGYASAGFNADSDGDGITDGLEYFFNQNPNGSGFANMAQLLPNGGAFELKFTRLTDTGNLNGQLQASGDLQTWTNSLLGLDYTVASSVVTGDETTFTYSLPGTGPSAPGASQVCLLPNTASDPAGASLGGVRVVNEGLVGVGRLSGESLDKFGETQGASSGLVINGWAYNAGQFSGTFNVLPDRGHGDGTSNYAARLHKVDFTFAPYYGAGPVAQNQVSMTYMDSTKFTYQDGPTVKFTTGLNPTGTSMLFSQTIGTVTAANGPGGAQENLLSIDAEAVYLFPDGSGYFSDEYGTYIARFDAAKTIIGLTQLPGAAQPFKSGVPNFDSVSPPTTGRRNNQGLEGMSVTPDGTRLFALLQSATVQDTNGAQQQTRSNARLFVYDIAGPNRENPQIIGEYVVKLPQIDLNADGSGADGTAAQSEIVALGNSSFLMLPRDANGLGKLNSAPILFKSVQLVDFASASNILGQYDGVGQQISPGGVLRDGINAAATAEIINMLQPDDLAKFGLNTNIPANANTLNEKIEAMALVPDLSTPAANDFFLFVGNDNDFESSDVQMLDAAGNVVSKGDGRLTPGITNDAMIYVWRLTIDAGGKKFFRFGVE